MIRFFLKCSLVLLIFFFGVILGMQKAHTGLENMRGYDDLHLYDAVSVQVDDGEVKGEFLGEEISSHDLKKKKERLEEMKAYNAFSKMGKKVASGVEGLLTKVMDTVIPE